MQQNDFTIRVMTRQDLELALEWAAAEGWNPGWHDADSFLLADPRGFLVGLVGDEPVATISVVRYGETFGFLGLYIVKPGYRGQGYGLQIWNAGLAHLHGRTIGLDGVVAQQENYRKSGFVLAYRNCRYEGIGGGQIPEDSAIVPLASLSLDQIHQYDSPLFPDIRTEFLHGWIRQPRGTALGILRNRSLAGYGVLRACRVGYKIGPLFADSPELAERLLLAFKARVPEGVPCFLDAPTINTAAVELMDRHHMRAVFETARMYQGEIPSTPLHRVFGVTTFELG